MAFWDIFSGTQGRQAAIWGAGNQQAGQDQQLGYIGTGQTAATNAVNAGQAGSINAINRGADLSLAALNQGAATGRNDLNRDFSAAQRTLGQGVNAALGAYNRNPALLQGAANKADAFYQPLGAEANRGFSTYGDAAGVNGAAGQNRARQNFRAGPGYQFMVDQGVNAATRAANASGMAASGNTLDATTRLGANLADQEFDDYMTRLSPYLNLAPQIAGQRAGIHTKLGQDLAANNAAMAGLYSGYGKDAAGLSAQRGTSMASLATGLGSNTSAVRTGQAANLSNINTGAAGSLANIATNAAASRSNIVGANTAATTGLGTSGLVAGQQGNANAWNAGMQVANLGVDAATGKFMNPFK